MHSTVLLNMIVIMVNQYTWTNIQYTKTFLLYYWRGGNDCYYLTKDTKVFSYFDKPLCWNIINLGLQAEALKTIKTNLKSI